MLSVTSRMPGADSKVVLSISRSTDQPEINPLLSLDPVPGAVL
jgi:hypothetical protein